MKQSTSRFAGLALFLALSVGAPLLLAEKHHYHKDKDKDECEWEENDCRVTAPDSHGAPILALAAGTLGAAMLFHRRRKATT